MSNPTQWLEAGISGEYAGAEFGDPRRARRLEAIGSQVVTAPGVGFPQVVADDGELEGLYRFLSNERVDAEAVLEPHVQQTLRRAREVGTCLILHDTTEFKFPGESPREGLGLTNGLQRGFFGHFALAVMPGEARLPLGVCGLQRIVRHRNKNSARRNWYQLRQDPTRESLRWLELVREVEARRRNFECIHVMDREGDIYEALEGMVQGGIRFVVRACYDRALADDQGLLRERLKGLKVKARRVVELSRRSDGNRTPAAKRKHPSRTAREARLVVSGCRVELKRPLHCRSASETLSLNVVRVSEPKSPSGAPAVEWMLYTTEEIGQPEQLLAVVDYYRSRWTIEEFFKALKTGCAIERRQLESYHALSNALAVFVPIAWRLLLARSLAREQPTARASNLLTFQQIAILKHRLKMYAAPQTVEQAVAAIAKLGGHLRRNGAPGWQTLGRGFEALLWMEVGWKAAAAQRSDQ
jgi:Transposase DNA-binding/Transposase DDE domain